FPYTTLFRSCRRVHTWRRRLALALAIWVWAASSRAARVRHRVESEAGAPRMGAWWVARRSASSRLVAPQAIAPARVIRAMALSRQPLAVLEGSTRARAVVRPVLSAQARRSRAPAWPMMFLPSLRTDRFWFQRVVSCTRRVLLFPA